MKLIPCMTAEMKDEIVVTVKATMMTYRPKTSGSTWVRETAELYFHYHDDSQLSEITGMLHQHHPEYQHPTYTNTQFNAIMSAVQKAVPSLFDGEDIQPASSESEVQRFYNTILQTIAYFGPTDIDSDVRSTSCTVRAFDTSQFPLGLGLGGKPGESFTEKAIKHPTWAVLLMCFEMKKDISSDQQYAARLQSIDKAVKIIEQQCTRQHVIAIIGDHEHLEFIMGQRLNVKDLTSTDCKWTKSGLLPFAIDDNNVAWNMFVRLLHSTPGALGYPGPLLSFDQTLTVDNDRVISSMVPIDTNSVKNTYVFSVESNSQQLVLKMAPYEVLFDEIYNLEFISSLPNIPLVIARGSLDNAKADPALTHFDF